MFSFLFSLLLLRLLEPGHTAGLSTFIDEDFSTIKPMKSIVKTAATVSDDGRLSFM